MTNYVPTATAVFELAVTCAAPTPLGRVNGGNAMMIPITGGTVSGEKLSGAVLAGGADWAVKYDNGIVVVDARRHPGQRRHHHSGLQRWLYAL